ncbi:MAG: hypothetical protein K8L97_15190 [Anaerolineae bacterium]|nr:hypothetical protein [Anaerolineae bacterium]
MSEFAIVAPPPLSPFKDVVVSPANIAVEQRQKKARKLTGRERRQVRNQLRKIQKQLKRSNLGAIRAVYGEMHPRMAELHNTFADLKSQLLDHPHDEKLLADLAQLRQQLDPMRMRWEAVKAQGRKLEPLLTQRRKLTQLLSDHQLAVERDKAEAKIRRDMQKEAVIYYQIIIDRWTALGFCHRYSKDGKERVHRVGFSQVAITMDAVYFKIDTSFKTAFGGWKTNIPDGVKVREQLLHESTLDELSVACTRQVTGVFSPDGAWVVVHRLESADGLMNYVRYDDVIERYPGQYHPKMPICVGVGTNRLIQWINLSDFPHWLIGGFTNSGKSNMVNVAIATLISKQSPRDLRLVLIDLKGGLEFDYYADIPHLHGKIISTVEDVANILSDMESLMKERFARFRGIAKTLSEYTARRPHDYMPRVLVVFDEVASFSSHGELTKRIMASLRELVRQGRAVGIHIILCTQRPDTQALDGSVKANLAVRISGRMPTSGDSVTILGNSAAKDLAAIPGRMVMALGPDPVQIQSPHITSDDVAFALKIACQYPTPPPLEIPEGGRVIHQEWTVERVIELSIRHLGGRITWKDVYQAVDDLSQSQARKLVERVWNMNEVEFEGKKYRVQKGRSNLRTLVQVEQNVT